MRRWMPLVLAAMLFAGIGTAIIGTAMLWTHRQDMERALPFVAGVLHRELERRFHVLQERFLTWTPLEDALARDDRRFLETQETLMTQEYGVRAAAFFRQGMEIFRMGAWFPGSPPIRSAPGPLEGFFAPDGEPLVCACLPVSDGGGRYRGVMAWVALEVRSSLGPLATFLGYTLRLELPRSDATGQFSLGVDSAHPFWDHRPLAFWILALFFLFGTGILALAFHHIFRQRDLSVRLRTLSSVLAQRDAYTAGHSDRVVVYAARIAREMGICGPALAQIREAAQLHDLGKVLVPDAILLKPGALSAEEFEIIKKHPAARADMVFSILERRDIAAVIRGHHERWDGSGYPDGLVGSAIPPHARILAVADVIDAMSTARPYHPPRSLQEVRSFLTTQRGVLFAPEVVDAALLVLAEPWGVSGTRSPAVASGRWEYVLK